MADGRGTASHGHAGIAAVQPRHAFDCKKDFRTRQYRVFSISYAESGRTRPIAEKGAFELPCRWRKSLSYIQKALRHDLRKGQNERMVGARGFEPPTPCAQGRCATRLRYAPTLERKHSFLILPDSLLRCCKPYKVVRVFLLIELFTGHWQRPAQAGFRLTEMSPRFDA